jgi:uncharacterized protein with von Willebrand factor type A (vWA) domain
MAGEDAADEPNAGLFAESVYGELVSFVRALRAAGAEVPSNASVSAAEALAEAGVTDRERTRAALRAAVLTRADDRTLFDRLFEQFWGRLQDAIGDARSDDGEDAPDDDGFSFAADEAPSEAEVVDELPEESERTGERELSLGEAAGDASEVYETSQYSPIGASESVTALSGTGEDGVEAAVARLTSVLATEAGRSSERANAGLRPDVRRALRTSVSTGGVLTDIPERRQKRTAVRGVVFADVSRSMLDVLDREFLVAFLRAAHSAWRSARTFIFDTDVRDVTDAVAAPTPTETFEALEAAETAWGGGTRIGHALGSVRETNPDVVDRRTVVVIVSDGLEMGDLEDLETAMAWVARRSPLVLWLNPLAKSAEYEPTAAGMAAALPYVDCLYPFADIEDVSALARDLERYPPRNVGYRAGAVE